MLRAAYVYTLGSALSSDLFCVFKFRDGRNSAFLLPGQAI